LFSQEGFDADKIGAEFKNGVLEVRVPLPATAKEKPTTIPVNG
jgi:HSP20 family molecular chaperone IbpA